jgi:PilZ domain
LGGDFGSVLERTVTVNVSPHGARVKTKRPWLENDQVVVASLASDFNVRARVVYCDPQGNDEFCLGLEFRPGYVGWQFFARS